MNAQEGADLAWGLALIGITRQALRDAIEALERAEQGVALSPAQVDLLSRLRGLLSLAASDSSKGDLARGNFFNSAGYRRFREIENLLRGMR